MSLFVICRSDPECSADDADFAPALLGQLKHVFDFDVSADSDEDDLPDWWEVHWFGGVTNWTGSSDADVDELSNLLEYQNMASPTNSDTDDDGMPDGWEVGYSLDPLADDSADDPDGDGFSNGAEYLQGANPRSSLLKCNQVNWQSMIGLRVQVGDSENCGGGNSEHQIVTNVVMLPPLESCGCIVNVTVEGQVEAQNAGYDKTYVNDVYFFEGDENGQQCSNMVVKTVNNDVTVCDRLVLTYDTIDPLYHVGCYAKITDIHLVNVLKVDIRVDDSDPDSYYLNSDGGVDNIATVKGSGDMVLKAVLDPDTPEIRNMLTWDGAAQQADKITAKVARSTAMKQAVAVKVNGNTCREGNAWVVWTEFTALNNTGPTPSDSSVSPTASYGASHGFEPGIGYRNGVLLQCTITPVEFGGVSSVEYDIKRTKERGIWTRPSGGSWAQDSHVGPDADDDPDDSDEDLTPSDNGHIYVIDSPGFGFPSTNAFAESTVYKAAFVEFVEIKLGNSSFLTCSDSFFWHSITWLDADPSGQWTRRSGANEVTSGTIVVGTSSTP